MTAASGRMGQDDSGEKPVLILGAMEEEIRAMIAGMEGLEQQHWNGYTLNRGRIDGVPVIVCKSGVGKVFASLITQHLISAERVRAVLFTGVAGAVNAVLEPGDVVVGARLIYHDMDGVELGFAPGHIPFTELCYFDGHGPSLARVREFAADTYRLLEGTIGTGDKFVTCRDGLPALELDCVDMEGCAVAHVCHVNQVPAIVLRIISDTADGRAAVEFAANLPRFADRTFQLIRWLLPTV